MARDGRGALGRIGIWAEIHLACGCLHASEAETTRWYEFTEAPWRETQDLQLGKPGDRGVTAAGNRTFVNGVPRALRSGPTGVTYRALSVPAPRVPAKWAVLLP